MAPNQRNSLAAVLVFATLMTGCASQKTDIEASQPVEHPQVRISHLQHMYAGGGGCAERFWIEAIGFHTELTNLRIEFSVSSRNERDLAGGFSIERLGTYPADSEAEGAAETVGCPSGRPKITIVAATVTVAGKTIDLLKEKMLAVGTMEKFQITY